jgi:dCTP deaminase
MGVLSDVRILERIYDKKLTINPFIYDHIQPSSIDLTLDNKIQIPKSGLDSNINVYDQDIKDYFEERTFDQHILLEPGDFIIGEVRETIGLYRDMVGNIQNRNSLIRLGINVGLSTYINPGYHGKLPIVINNLGKFNVNLVPGMRICQLVISDVEPEPERDYSQQNDAKYIGEKGKGLSKLYLDKEFEEFLKIHNKTKIVEADSADLIKFLENRLESRSVDITIELSNEEKRKLGLLRHD